jgi:hypothetical protein
MIPREQLDIRLHAAVRMLERRITIEDILPVLNDGEAIESYPEDTPWPSQLTLGFVRTCPLHVVWAEDGDTKRVVIITVYEPDVHEWDSAFRRRRRRS